MSRQLGERSGPYLPGRSVTPRSRIGQRIAEKGLTEGKACSFLFRLQPDLSGRQAISTRLEDDFAGLTVAADHGHQAPIPGFALVPHIQFLRHWVGGSQRY